jgi:hypothetical protein
LWMLGRQWAQQSQPPVAGRRLQPEAGWPGLQPNYLLDQNLPDVRDCDLGLVNGRDYQGILCGLCVHLRRLILWPSSPALESKLISNPTAVRRSLAVCLLRLSTVDALGDEPAGVLTRRPGSGDCTPPAFSWCRSTAYTLPVSATPTTFQPLSSCTFGVLPPRASRRSGNSVEGPGAFATGFPSTDPSTTFQLHGRGQSDHRVKIDVE